MPEKLKSFQEVLTDAVNDIVEHGFDSTERVDRWTRELKAAAERSLISETSMEQQLREALAEAYRKQVEMGGLERNHVGVERFTIERIKPELRNELDRRILASASLIRLNRNEAIEKTLRRFQGWATSIPPGGVSRETKREVKENVRKSLAGLPFEERRVLIDQGHKLVGAINEIVAADGGAIAGRWRSNWRQPGYNYREDHKERDNEIYLVRDSWAHQAGYVKKGAVGYYDEVTAVGQEPFCRCYMIWLYNLRDLPENMLTKKGKEALSIARGKEEVRAARADSIPAGLETLARPDEVGTGFQGMLDSVGALDRCGYLRGLTCIETVSGPSKWHSSYDPDNDTIRLEPNFFAAPAAEQVHMLLHEAGHRGQDVDAETYETFKRLHLNSLPNFLDMANPVHLEDFRENGEVESVAAEVFAESYARACTGQELPAQLAAFWSERLNGAVPAGRMMKDEAEYIDVWSNRVTRCQRCTMFVRVQAATLGNACKTVAGDISAHGHCKEFFITGARTDSAEDAPAPKVGPAADILRLERLKARLLEIS